MSTVNPGTQSGPPPAEPLAAVPLAPPAPAAPPQEAPELIVYSHSSFFYWWPVWAVGYLMAVLTYWGGVQVQIGDIPEWFHPSKNPGVIYTVVLFLVIVMTNITVRGLASVVVIISVLFLTVLFAYLDWWDRIFHWLSLLSIHMNLGFYLLFSTLIFLFWASTFFIFDRLTYWRVKPGQVTQEFVIGGGQRAYDTHGMVVEKFHEDFFRHWILGLGAGDMRISTTGARREELLLPNVILVDRKVKAVQKLIAIEPSQLNATSPTT
jgi:hypothetical protein